MWQDWVFAIGNIVFAIALVPTVLENRKLGACSIPYVTSITTFLVLITFAFAAYTMEMFMSTAMFYFTAILWMVIALQRHTYGTKKILKRLGSEGVKR